MINVRVVILMSMVVIAAHAASPCSGKLSKKTKPEKFCLGISQPCLTSKYPCCPFNYKGGITGPKPLFCFKFGKGICQEFGSIKNHREYNRLVQQLNETNFEALKKKYWASVLAVKTSTFIPQVIQI